MKSEMDLNNDIINMTMKIHDEFPELSKYMAEMPITIPNEDNPEINNKNLQDYYNSLETLLKKYTRTHVENT
jgi:hypothetical protein